MILFSSLSFLNLSFFCCAPLRVFGYAERIAWLRNTLCLCVFSDFPFCWRWIKKKYIKSRMIRVLIDIDITGSTSSPLILDYSSLNFFSTLRSFSLDGPAIWQSHTNECQTKNNVKSGRISTRSLGGITWNVCHAQYSAWMAVHTKRVSLWFSTISFDLCMKQNILCIEYFFFLFRMGFQSKPCGWISKYGIFMKYILFSFGVHLYRYRTLTETNVFCVAIAFDWLCMLPGCHVHCDLLCVAVLVCCKDLYHWVYWIFGLWKQSDLQQLFCGYQQCNTDFEHILHMLLLLVQYEWVSYFVRL